MKVSLAIKWKGRQVRNPKGIKFLLIQAHTATTTLDIDMATESGSTDFNDFFYGVRASFIHLLCFRSQNLVSVRITLYRSRGHLPPGRPSIASILRSTQLHVSIRSSRESVSHAICPGDYTGFFPYSSLRPRPVELSTSNRHPCQRWSKTLCHLFCVNTTVTAHTHISDGTILPCQLA